MRLRGSRVRLAPVAEAVSVELADPQGLPVLSVRQLMVRRSQRPRCQVDRRRPGIMEMVPDTGAVGGGDTLATRRAVVWASPPHASARRPAGDVTGNGVLKSVHRC